MSKSVVEWFMGRKLLVRAVGELALAGECEWKRCGSTGECVRNRRRRLRRF